MNQDNESQPLELDLRLLDLQSRSRPNPGAGPAVIETPSPQQRRQFDPALGRRQREEQAKVDAALKATLDEMRKSLPAELKLNGSGRVTIKGPAGGSAVFKALFQEILSPTGAAQTQTAIRNAVQARFPTHAVTKDWTAKLPYWAVDQLKTQVRCSVDPFASIRVTQKTTLASLHRDAKAAWQRRGGGAFCFKADISVSDDTLTINGVPFKITMNKAKGHTYPIARVNITKLISVTP